MNIILIGMMGSGKSTIASELSKRLELDLIDIDSIIEKTNDMSIKDMFDKYGEEHFRKLEKALFLELADRKNSIISTGGGAILNDALEPFETQNIIYLKWSINGLLSNLTNKVDNRPLLNQASLEEKLIDIYELRKDLYERWAKHIIDCDNKSVDEVVMSILKVI
ncbi:MAG: shikimate kinase [Acidaminobacteraceae bacterium]